LQSEGQEFCELTGDVETRTFLLDRSASSSYRLLSFAPQKGATKRGHKKAQSFAHKRHKQNIKYKALNIQSARTDLSSFVPFVCEALCLFVAKD
jgi:hypothetical protein